MAASALQFNEVGHAYFDDGVWRPSLTQILKLSGLYSFDKIPPDVLAAKAKIGTDVHQLIECHGKFGDVDPGWLTDENRPYFEAYLKFRRECNYVPDPEWSERQWIAEIHGRRFGLKLDSRGRFNGNDALCEWKCSALRQDAWGYQLAGQEMAVHKTTRVGRMTRIAVALMKGADGKGKYRLEQFENHANDAQVFIAALTTTHERLRIGQELWRLL